MTDMIVPAGDGDAPATPTLDGARDDMIRRSGRRLGDAALAAAILAPSLVVFAAFFFYPLYRLVHLALNRPDNFGRREVYVGPSQLWSTLTGDQFSSGLRITLTFVVLTVPLGIVLGTLLAVAAHRRLKGIRIFQTIFSSTVASSAAVASVVFFVLLNPEAGYFRNISFFSLANPDSALRNVARRRGGEIRDCRAGRKAARVGIPAALGLGAAAGAVAAGIAVERRRHPAGWVGRWR